MPSARASTGLSNGGSANFVTTFTTHYQANSTPVLAIPDFARGPDSHSPIAVPNSGAGIPVTLYNARNITAVTFSLTTSAALLNITGTLQGSASDATDPAGTLALISNTGGVATFSFHDATPQSGTVILGDITALVPDSARNLYQVKEILQLGDIVLNQGAGAAVAANGMHVNTYFGDVNADHRIDGLDKLSMNAVAQGQAAGFSAFAQLDPALVGDVAGDFSVDAGDVSLVDAFIVQLAPAQIPAPPGLAGITSPTAPDPTLSLVPVTSAPAGPSDVVFAVQIDHPRPAGSSGITEAVLALAYDPHVLTIAPADIMLGPLPSQGAGWQFSSVLDPPGGQIALQLYSQTPIATDQPGTLVTLTFRLVEGASASDAWVRLVDSVTLFGQRYSTVLADLSGALVVTL